MPTENDFLAFACGSGANVETQSVWASDTVVTNGFQSGVANSIQVNKVLRQASIMASMLAQFIVDNSGQPAIDNGTTATLETNLKAAINALIATGLIPYAPLASPTLTGTPAAPTPSTSDNTTKIATTAFVKNQAYAPLASPALTGTPSAPTPSTSDNTTKIATTAFVMNQAYAPLASPALTGYPTAPTQSNTDNSSHLATTAWVIAAIASGVYAMNASTLYAASANLTSCITSPPPAGDASTLVPNTQWVATYFAALSAFGNSLGANGYQKLPGGLILQWGYATCAGSSGGDVVSYPISFTSALCVAGNDAGNGGHVVSFVNSAASYFTAYCRANNSASFVLTNVHWIAIGY